MTNNPVLEPYKKGFLDVGPDSIGVGTGHKIYYELHGNPKGKPILYVHGGPGVGFSENAKKWFDLELWNVILFDQRGAGHSTPFASLEHNTTDDLVSDINKLLDHIGVQKVTLFGGSWGSTLSLVYAIRNTERVNGMILRGIFLPSKEHNQYMFGGGIQKFAPKEWERFLSLVPEDKRTDPTQYYAEKMMHGTHEEKEKYAYEWAYYEVSLMQLKITGKEIGDAMSDGTYRALSPLEAHYLLNNCFLPENYILDNAHTLSKIPTYIIHGKYDRICPPGYAYDLSQKIKGSKLVFTIAGHASSDRENKKKLLWALKKIYPFV